MTEATEKTPRKRLKRLRNSALFLVALSVLACELPLLLAMIGLSGVVFTIPSQFVLAFYTVATCVLLVLSIFLIYRWQFRNKVRR